jgi:hypothetical protein
MEWKTKGTEDNEMEWNTRPLGAQRIYPQSPRGRIAKAVEGASKAVRRGRIGNCPSSACRRQRSHERSEVASGVDVQVDHSVQRRNPTELKNPRERTSESTINPAIEQTDRSVDHPCEAPPWQTTLDYRDTSSRGRHTTTDTRLGSRCSRCSSSWCDLGCGSM